MGGGEQQVDGARAAVHVERGHGDPQECGWRMLRNATEWFHCKTGRVADNKGQQVYGMVQRETNDTHGAVDDDMVTIVPARDQLTDENHGFGDQDTLGGKLERDSLRNLHAIEWIETS